MLQVEDFLSQINPLEVEDFPNPVVIKVDFLNPVAIKVDFLSPVVEIIRNQVNNLNNNKIPWEILLIALSFNSWLC